MRNSEVGIMREDILQQWREALSAKGEIILQIRVHPGARKTCIKDVMVDGTVKIDIAVAPEEGRANTALVEFLSEEFSVARSKVEIVAGKKGRRKTICVHQ